MMATSRASKPSSVVSSHSLHRHHHPDGNDYLSQHSVSASMDSDEFVCIGETKFSSPLEIISKDSLESDDLFSCPISTTIHHDYPM